MKKNFFKMFLFGFVSLFISNEFVAAAEEMTIETDIYYGQTINFIKGHLYDEVSCSYSGDLQYFEFSKTEYSYDHFVEVINAGAKSGKAVAVCNYGTKKAHNGANVQTVSRNGTDTFIFNLKTPDANAKSKFEVNLHRQLYTWVDMGSYLTIKENSGADTIILSDSLAKLFGASTSCNNQSCVLNLIQNAPVGKHVGTAKYGNYEFEMTVNVSDEWIVSANTGGYGNCKFEEGWELNKFNEHYYEKSIHSQTTELPVCGVDTNEDGVPYKALEFVGWVYNKQSSNDNYNNYQSVDVCATFKDGHDPKVGFLSAGQPFSPAALQYSSHGNSVFYACYKRTGIGFNLLGAKLEDDTYGIQKWSFAERDEEVTYMIHYKIFQDGTKTMKLPSKVSPSGLDENEEFVGWINNRDGYDNVIPGGTEVSVEEGLIYMPYFLITKAETERIVTVYTNDTFVLELPSTFTCPNEKNDNFSIVGTGSKCVITGIASTNDEYIVRSINSGGKTFTLKIKVVQGAYSGGQIIDDVVIGNGDLTIDPGENGDGTNATIKVPADCNSYYVGKIGSGTASNPIFHYQPTATEIGELKKQKIFTYYARSNCSSDVKFEIEYAALCIDPGRTGPTSSNVSPKPTKNGGTANVREYKFFKYIDVNDENEDYAEFSKAVAHIVSKIGYMPLANFNAPNNIDKIAANMALRILTVDSDLSSEPDHNDLTYFQAHLAYYSMYQHLGKGYKPSLGNQKGNGRLGRPDADVVAREDANHTCDKDAVIACNKEWKWLSSEFNGAHGTVELLQDRLAEFLNYGANTDILKESWEQEPEVEVSSNDGEKIVLLLTYPKTINFRYDSDGNPSLYGKYDISINLSKEMSKYYQFEENYPVANHLKCADGARVEGRCLRYDVRLLDGSETPDGFYKHEIYMKLTPDSDPSVFPTGDTRDLYLEVGYTSNATKRTAFLVEPAKGSDTVQRMVLFNPEKITKVYPLLISDCNKLLQKYGNTKEKYEAIFKAGCCETISDDSTAYQDFVNTYCKKDCVMNNYKPVCVTGDTGKNYEVKEAMTKAGNINYACVVDVREADLDVSKQISMLKNKAVTSPDAYANTSNMTDITGKNSIAISSFANNPYCRVTCKEDWKFDMPGYGDFLGNKAVAAGSLFQINSPIKLSSNVTCVTSYINIDGYKEAINSLSTDIYNLYKEYSLRAAAHKDIKVEKVNENDQDWYTYTYTTGKNCTYTQYSNSAVTSCTTITGSYTFKCTADDWGHPECRSGNYITTPACNSLSDDDGELGGNCHVEGKYTTPADAACLAANPTNPDICKHECVNLSDHSNCKVGGTYNVSNSCVNSDTKLSGCSIDSSKTYSVDCTSADLSNGSFVSKTNSTNNCGFGGTYTEISKQVKHSGNGETDPSSKGCRIFKITSPANTNVSLYDSSGTKSNATSVHGRIWGLDGDVLTDGYAQTNYSSGSVDLCKGATSCDVANITPVNGSCETQDDKSESTWKEHLIKNHAVYNGDSKTLIRDKMVSIYDDLVSKKEDMSLVINAFGKCQNFYVNNTSTNITKPTYLFGGAAYTSDIETESFKVLQGVSNTPYNIDTQFNPAGTFGYDEKEYMGLMGSDRNIAPVDNSMKINTYSSMYNTINNNIVGFNACYGSDGQYIDSNGNPVACSSTIGNGSYEVSGYNFSYVEDGQTKYYGLTSHPRVLCNIGAISSNSIAAAFDYDTSSDICGHANYYYFNANYVKKSINSSAEFENYVTWYKYLPDGVIYPGVGFESADSKYDAATKYPNYSYNENEYNKWSTMGTKNVFPVSLNTKRNIYQYYYTFKGIGNFYNNSEPEKQNIGRIMGYDISIIKSNSRVCFYEVYESACICCGNNSLGPVSQQSKVNTQSFVQGFRYSDYDKDGSGRYGFTTSTVSLYNLKGNSSNTKGANWSANEHYFYNGNGGYTTDKGKELADYIEQKGENVYSETPEYSYILTPDAMANIRKLNSSATYGYGRDTVYTDNTYTYLVYAENKDHSVNSNETDRIIFTHFGSKFVRDKLSAYETPQYKGDLLSNKDMSLECYVENANQLKDKKDCKWVDYLEPSGSGHFRMAFK